MKKDNLLILACLGFILFLGGILYFYGLNQEYKYLCFNTEVTKDTLITEDYLKICTTNKKLPKGVIREKDELLSEDSYKFYKLTKDSYQKGEMLYEEDFILYELEKTQEEKIELLTKLQVSSSINNDGSYINNSEDLIKYNIYVKNKKIYATNLNNGKVQLIFDIEEVKNIAVRPICCTGNGNLLVLTTSGNVYISENDCNYFFTFDFPFKKLEATDVVSFKLVPTSGYDNVKNLYGINSKGEEILLQKIN